jgi:hypothetical protein
MVNISYLTLLTPSEMIDSKVMLNLFIGLLSNSLIMIELRLSLWYVLNKVFILKVKTIQTF